MAALLLSAGCTAENKNAQASTAKEIADDKISITDSLGREVTVPKDPQRVVCSGSGALRYLTYLQAQDKTVGVDDIEYREDATDARPYRIANTQFKDLPLIGEFRGNDDPEKIIALNPDVIFKTYVTSTADADKLSEKTGVPVVALNYGDIGYHRQDAYESLRIMGKVMVKEERAEEVIAFFEDTINDLNSRTKDVPDSTKKTCYIGGVSYRGPHGMQSTQPEYPPFIFLNADNVAGDLGTEHADVAKEKIIEWNPSIIFLDLASLRTNPSGLDELKNDPSYQILDAVKSGEVYGVIPYNSYTANHGNVLADAYYIGKVLYPDNFKDIEPKAKADEIFEFLVAKPVFDQMNTDAFKGLGFTKLEL
ncbi:iron ABC transporter substrate-binding protein [Methanoplanus sp. FWC-SCC4]|uniref:Iron ABC transporter substrate-binding protein n=2 Tax=Methanochimaera problematica TaxID=2609417 RepID=A0AA97FFK9_9EURY|nr:iron ABC transporter substrate-binding protein [Methanoplanus sp. FWC-SCC4]